MARVLRILLLGVIVLGLAGCSSQATEQEEASPQPPAHDLTGVWDCDDGGTYYMRQIGDTVWWYGESEDSGASWTNVFNGVMSADEVDGSWADVPLGSSENQGEMSLEATDEDLLVTVGDTPGFGGSEWVRRAE